MSKGDFWRNAALGIAFIWVVALLGISIDLAKQVDVLQMKTAQALQFNQSLRQELNLLRSDQAELSRTFEEFQSWRVHVTLASRMGWGPAHRYLRTYPLEEVGQ